MKYMTIKQRDGSVWGVPVGVIARNRAEYYAHEFGGDIERSLAEDTNPVFQQSNYEIQDWALNNMDWSDFALFAIKITPAPEPDFNEAWGNARPDDIGFHEVRVVTNYAPGA